LFIGEVIAASVDEKVMKDEVLDPIKAKPIIQKNHVYFTITNKK
jgi:flavin reductase (DIM6/NTAB) family NADH-FMN oxidoreductase RutF